MNNVEPKHISWTAIITIALTLPLLIYTIPENEQQIVEITGRITKITHENEKTANEKTLLQIQPGNSVTVILNKKLSQMPVRNNDVVKIQGINNASKTKNIVLAKTIKKVN